MCNDPNCDNKKASKKCHLERDLFGVWGYRLRLFCGTLAVVSICFNSSLYAWTIHESIIHGVGWPDWKSLGIMSCGPVIVGWAFTNVNKILQIFLSGNNDRSLKDRLTSAGKEFVK